MNSKPKHSPGPWRWRPTPVHSHPSNWDRALLEDANVNRVLYAIPGPSASQADICLIAAAPELLQVARDLLVADETWFHDVERRARGLIRRIEGEE